MSTATAGEVTGLTQSIRYAQHLAEEAGLHGPDGNESYAERYVQLGPDIAALIPQVYLHYDPYTALERRARGPLPRQRMDFLLLLPRRARVVIECDGKQHYADDDGRADPRQYADMMRADRDLRLKGYEVYRFGGAELTDDRTAERLLGDFFDCLAKRHPRSTS